jgi:hypothetical protein
MVRLGVDDFEIDRFVRLEHAVGAGTDPRWAAQQREAARRRRRT